MNNITIKKDVEQNCPGHTMEILGDNGEFESMANQDLSYKEKCQEIGNTFTNRHPSGSPPGTTYEDLYSKHFINIWEMGG
jgi:hypothetical protein